MALIDRERAPSFSADGVRPVRLGRGVPQELSHRTDRSTCGPRGRCHDSAVSAWLRHQNANRWNVYVSVNSIRPGRSRARTPCFIFGMCFLKRMPTVTGLLAALTTRPDVPPPSYVLHSSPGRVHVFWRARGFSAATVEGMQKRLATELRTMPPRRRVHRPPDFLGSPITSARRRAPSRSNICGQRTVLTPTDFPLCEVTGPVHERRRIVV